MNRAETEEKIRQIVEKIVKEYQPEKIILFGSWAWGTPGPDSDVDLFIVKESEERRLERERGLGKLLFGYGFPPMDFLVYTPEELETGINQNHNLFLEDIVRNGKTLYSKSEDTVHITNQRPLVILHNEHY